VPRLLGASSLLGVRLRRLDGAARVGGAARAHLLQHGVELGRPPQLAEQLALLHQHLRVRADDRLDRRELLERLLVLAGGMGELHVLELEVELVVWIGRASYLLGEAVERAVPLELLLGAAPHPQLARCRQPLP